MMLPLPAQDIRIWQVDLRRQPEWVDAAAERLLKPDELEWAARGTPEVRRRRLVARAALRIALSRCLACSPAAIRFAWDETGKPALAAGSGGPEVHFNVSRSGDCCVIALTKVGPIGVDVEWVVPRAELDEIVSSRFAPVEAAAIARLSGDQRLRAFYNCWTRKEAYLKARGVGVATALDQVAMTVGDERPAILSLGDDDPRAWSLATVEPGPGLAGAVVLRGAHEWAGGAVQPSLLRLGPIVD
jgi:4'-phosphopantetheinyl transferase